jgi:ribonuclease-3
MINPNKALEKNLGVKFKDAKFLQEALTHRSYLNEASVDIGNNERLEFLGDAVIELVVTEYLFKKFPHKPEGELTSLRAALVRKESLAKVAEDLEIVEHLHISRGEKKNLDKSKSSLAADAFEAVTGAIYLDQGIVKARSFLAKKLIPALEKILAEGRYIDPKSRWQEIAQEKYGLTPTYRVLQEWGPDHAKHFRIGVYLGDKKLAAGEGRSKQEAEQSAAKEALEKEE